MFCSERWLAGRFHDLIREQQNVELTSLAWREIGQGPQDAWKAGWTEGLRVGLKFDLVAWNHDAMVFGKLDIREYQRLNR